MYLTLRAARPNNSFKPTPCRGVGRVLYATLARTRRPATGRLNSGVRPLMKEWAYFTWFPGHGLNMIHPHNQAKFTSGVQALLGTTYPEEEGWVPFSIGEYLVRLRPEVLHRCPAPAFSYGQLVHAVPPRSPFIGHIMAIQWHYKRSEPIFFLCGKKGRYFTHELHAA